MELSEHLSRSGGNKHKLVQHHRHCGLRKLNFTYPVIPIWNSLSNHVVSADTAKSFQNRLDNFWSNNEILYDYKGDLHGIGNCSTVMYVALYVI